MKNHTKLLNYLAETFNLQSYLEIGVSIPADNFDKIVCSDKIGVDPLFTGSDRVYKKTSDDFFSDHNDNFKFDLIFIDGLHHADQVKRDFENSLKCLTDNGFILIHDTLPEKEEYTHVPRGSKVWNGDVYKFAMNLNKYRGIGFCTVDIDHGCTVVWKLSGNSKYGHSRFDEITWQMFEEKADELMYLIDADNFKTYMQPVISN